MNEPLSRYWLNANQYWSHFNRNQKIMIVSIVVLTLLTIVLLTIHFSKTEYSWAYRDLDAIDAAAIKNYLEAEGIPYKFSTDGTSVGVPTSEVTRVKLDVASQNLIVSGSQGFGLFRDNISSFGMTDDEFNVLNVDARAGEIQKLLHAYNGVAEAKVLLALPEESVFVNTSGESEKASAPVSVRFKLGYRPDQKMIDSMYNTVRTGVGVSLLPLGNITITDQSGEMLPSTRQGSGGGASSVVTEHFQIKKQYELEIQRKIETLLERLFGPDKVVVSVVATLNFDQKVTDQTLYTPSVGDNGIIRSSEETSSMTESESGGQQGGVAGTGETDIPTYPAGGGGGNSSSEDITRTVNYEVNQINQSIVSSPYVVDDLMISAGIEPPDEDNPDSLSQEVLDEVRKILVGTVSVALANSQKPYLPQDYENKVSLIAQTFLGKPAEAPVEGVSPTILYGIGAAALAIAAAAGLFVFRRRKAIALEEAEAAAAAAAAAQAIQFPTIDIETVSNENQVRKQLESLAKKKPEEFVNLLRTWLVDE